MTTADLELAERRARELLVFADGVAELVPQLARRSRVVSDDALRLVEAVRAERSAREAVQEQRDVALEILAGRAYGAAERAARA